MSFCGNCGVPRSLSASFCGACGANLAQIDREVAIFNAQAQAAHAEPQVAPAEQSVPERISAFWSRHLVLNVATLTAAACWAFYWSENSSAIAALAMLISVALLPSWWIALTSPNALPRFVGVADRSYERLYGFVSNREGKVVRLLLIPIIWAGARWAKFADNRDDSAVAASLRIFGYGLAVMLLISLIILAVYVIVAVIIALLMIAAALWILGLMLDTADGSGDSFEPTRSRMRSSKIYKHRGGFLEPEVQMGRIDEDGRIYKDDGRILGVPERVGRIDEKGRIFEGRGGFFNPDRQVGRIDEKGRIYKDDGSILGVPERIGKIDEGGRIQRGSGGFFDPDQQVGKIRPDK